MECDVTSEPLIADWDPYEVVVPYRTCVDDVWSVVQVIVAEVVVIPVAVTALITRGATPVVVNV